jgi:putative ABC transport system permease protein
MHRIAMKMLFGDAAKCIGLIFGVAFASLLIMQQSSTFISLMIRSSSVVLDAQEVNLWVMDPAVRYIDGSRPMRSTELSRVRGVAGVAWAVPLFKASASVRKTTGEIENAQVIGLDEATFIGAPTNVVLGSLEALRSPDAVMIDYDGYSLLFPGQPHELGRIIEINDRRAIIGAIVRASPNFSANLLIYTTYQRALGFTNNGRNSLSFVAARAVGGETPASVARRIEAETGLRARTSTEFMWDTINYFLANTGIPVSFGTVVGLGIIVGVVVAGLTFNMFVAENIKQFAALKAIGVTNGTIFTMVLAQAGVVGTIGYGIGLGVVAHFFNTVPKQSAGLRGMFLTWEVAAAMAILTVIIMLIASALSLRRVLTVDPAVVFRG